MYRRRTRWAALIGLVCVVGLAMAALIAGGQLAVGQEQPRAPLPPEAGRVPGQPEQGAPRPGAEWRRQGGPVGDEARRGFDAERARAFLNERMMVQQPPAIAVAEGKVFIVMGLTLYKFDAGTLALEGQQRIPMPMPTVAPAPTPAPAPPE